MNSTTKGLVIREQTTGENDRLVTLLTADHGLVRAFVRGGKQLKNRRAAATSLFCYGEFALYRGRDAYTVDSAAPIEVFFGLRQDIDRLAAAQYFAQLSYELAAEEQPAPELLRLLLNTLYMPAAQKRPLRLSISGYMPNILACANCGTYETPVMYFDVDGGCIYCENCPKAGAVAVPKTVMTAVRYICLTEPGRIFGFALSPEEMALLGRVTEQYTLRRLDRRFTTLEFYKSLQAGDATT